MLKNKNILIIISIIFVTPVIGYLLGSAGATRVDDHSGLSQIFSFWLAVDGAVVSCITGVITSIIMRNSTSTMYALSGYIIPNALMLLYIAFINLTG